MEQEAEDLEQPVRKYPTTQTIVLLGVLIIMAALVIVAVTAFRASPTDTNTPPEQQTQSLNLAPYSIIYGVWNGNNSLIKSFDLSSGKTYVLATLPVNVKKVTVLDNHRLLYIANTDTLDHGTEIDVYSIKSKTSTPVVKAANSFGIDDYVLSPNKQYLADWEVQVNSATNTLSGGRSRVYSASVPLSGSLNAPSKHLIYDELSSATMPVHYPVGILDDGTVYTDRFLPNSGVGWDYGMSVSNFDGSSKQDLANMQNGTYGTQPTLSPNGKYFLFAGYDGSEGVGTASTNGFRQALVTSNTIELLDTSNDQRIKLPNLPNTNTYTNLSWINNDTFSYTQIAQNTSVTASYDYALSTHRATSTPEASAPIVTTFANGTFLTGVPNNSSSYLGNLGESYSQLLSQISFVNIATNKTTLLPLSDPLIQFITTAPASSFAYVSEDTAAQAPPSNHQLQLQTLPVKPNLAPQRASSQSQPPNSTVDQGLPICMLYFAAQCGIPLVGSLSNPTSEEQNQDLMNIEHMTKEQKSCMQNLGFYNNYLPSDVVTFSKGSEGEPPKAVCYDSPLYLYGQKGEHVHVTVHTPVFNSSPQPENSGYTVTLSGNGTFQTNGKIYDKISYDYIPAAVKAPPTHGVIASQNNLNQTIQKFASKLGLNVKETDDLLLFAKTHIYSPYVFVSFYDNVASQQILPITFNPKPDSYRNIVFYFKQLNQKPSYIPVPPVFDPIRRIGFTAVEISERVE